MENETSFKEIYILGLEEKGVYVRYFEYIFEDENEAIRYMDIMNSLNFVEDRSWRLLKYGRPMTIR